MPTTTEQREHSLELAKLVRAGRAARDQLDHGALTPAECRAARKAVHAGERARDEMVLANRGLVYDAVNKLGTQRVKNWREDLEQEGMLGLLRAIDRFEPDKGFQFSTYAAWWIRDAIVGFLHDHGSTIRLPRKVRREQAQLLAATESGRSVEDACERLGITEERARDVLNTPFTLLPAESGSTDDGRDPLDGLAVTEDFTEGLYGPGGSITRQELWDALDDLLTDDERELLVARFGLDGREGATTAEMARQLGTPRLTVRAMEVRAIAKLRHPVVAHLVGELAF